MAAVFGVAVGRTTAIPVIKQVRREDRQYRRRKQPELPLMPRLFCEQEQHPDHEDQDG